MFPLILIHKDIPHLQWICSYNEEEELESVLINKHTKEIRKQILSENELDNILTEFKNNGWVRGYVPDINIRNDEGELIDTVKIT